MKVHGLHLLLTYQCLYECDHCFVWGSPRQSGTMTFELIKHILNEAEDYGGISSIYFEGGEPFLYYPLLLQGIEIAFSNKFSVGLVSNAYWATDPEDAEIWLKPLVGLVNDLSLSSDLYHSNKPVSFNIANALAAAEKLGLQARLLSIAQPKTVGSTEIHDSEEDGYSVVRYRGRAAECLIDKVTRHPGEEFTACPDENLEDPGRIHVDPFGNLHICQGIIIGNILEKSLKHILSEFDPQRHPIVGPLMRGGPAELGRLCGLLPGAGFADACHLCYEARLSWLDRYPSELGPEQMYGRT